MRTGLTRVAVLFGLCSVGCASSNGPAGDADGGLGSDGAIVDSGPDPTFIDADLTDAAPRLGFGEPCTSRDQCESRICVFSGISGVCSQVCNPPDCPVGYGCYSVLGGIEPGQLAEICVPESDQLCSPCTDSSECATAAQDLCVADADGLKWCARDCSAISCPGGYTCSDVHVGASTFRQCLPTSGACDCDATSQGSVKACMIPTPFGMCLGSKTCNGAAGWAMCAPPSSLDVPDGNFADENCDGIDGDMQKGIFVATTGDDAATCGLTYQTPCATVQKGITRAIIASRPHVYVQAGVYSGVVTLQNNVSIFGGYDTGWQRGPRGVAGHETRLVGALDSGEGQFMTVKAISLIVQTTVADVVIEGPDASGSVGPNGRSSYAVYARDASAAPAALLLQRVTIVAGDGAPGAAGTSGANATNVSPTVGMEGQPGGGASEFTTTCNSSSHGGGGPRGSNSCSGGSDPSGGAGGNGGEMDSSCPCAFSSCDATSGDGGGNAAVVVASLGLGGGGAAANSCLDGPGGGGQPGRIINGAAGSTATAAGSLSLGYWIGRASSGGGTGQNGGGGGGGGGSGGCDSGTDSYGTGGGGGGAGGCAAPAGGGGGGAGGSSFAVFAIGSTVSVAECAIQLGVGGAGGAGGVGGRGQSGGPGGGAGPGSGDSAPGGGGGAGVHGGHGGGGAGGPGGNSFGIFSFGSTVPQSCTFSGGASGGGGAGGASAPSAPTAERDGNAGPSGPNGNKSNVGTCAGAGGC